MSTRRLYFESTYLFESPATILEQAEDEKGSYVVLDQTIFYPQGGGQPSDRGIIKHGVQSLEISQVRQVEEEIRHYLNSTPQENLVNQRVDCSVQAGRRLLNARYHTAAHLLTNIVEILYPSLKATKGHSFPKESYVEFQNPESLSLLEQEKMSLGLQWGLQFGFLIRSFEIDPLSFEQQFHKFSYPIPENKKFRAVRIGEYAPIPCGGTHVADTREIGVINIGKIKCKGENIRISYEVIMENRN